MCWLLSALPLVRHNSIYSIPISMSLEAQYPHSHGPYDNLNGNCQLTQKRELQNQWCISMQGGCTKYMQMGQVA